MQRADPRRAGASIVGHGRGGCAPTCGQTGLQCVNLKKYWSKRQRVYAVQYSQDIDRGEAEKETPGRRLKADRDACHNPCIASASVQNAMHSLVFRPAFSQNHALAPLSTTCRPRRPSAGPAVARQHPLPGHCPPPGSPVPIASPQPPPRVPAAPRRHIMLCVASAATSPGCGEAVGECPVSATVRRCMRRSGACIGAPRGFRHRRSPRGDSANGGGFFHPKS